MTNNDIKNKTIQANLEALEQILYEANVRASEAVASIRQGERNGAMGAAIGIEEMLKQATALYGAAQALHTAR